MSSSQVVRVGNHEFNLRDMCVHVHRMYEHYLKEIHFKDFHELSQFLMFEGCAYEAWQYGDVRRQMINESSMEHMKENSK